MYGTYGVQDRHDVHHDHRHEYGHDGHDGHHDGHDNHHDPLADAIKGAIAGAAGVWLMDKVSTYLYQWESPETIKAEEAAWVEGKDPASVAADRLASAVGAEPTEEQAAAAASGVHYALGVVPGAVYGVIRPHVGLVGSGRGLVYGLALFLLNDETIGPALGLASGPAAYPWQAHARGLASHLVLGVATDAVLDVLDRIA